MQSASSSYRKVRIGLGAGIASIGGLIAEGATQVSSEDMLVTCALGIGALVYGYVQNEAALDAHDRATSPETIEQILHRSTVARKTELE